MSRLAKKDFEPSAFTGLWYEQAYIDPAQIGASCPTLNASLNVNNGIITAPFRVKYGSIPFSITEIYTPIGDHIYGKRVRAPGSRFVNLNTVFVDAVQRSKSNFHSVRQGEEAEEEEQG